MRRGEIWWATLPDPNGSEPGFSRPTLIISDDEFNASRLRTVVVATLTSNLRLAEAPGNVLLSRKASGLPKRSVVNVSQLTTLDKTNLAERVKRLAAKEMLCVDAGLKLVLSLP